MLRREQDPIINIEYKNPFNLKEHVNEKETILDIKAETNNKELIDIEMQLNWYNEMPMAVPKKSASLRLNSKAQEYLSKSLLKTPV